MSRGAIVNFRQQRIAAVGAVLLLLTGPVLLPVWSQQRDAMRTQWESLNPQQQYLLAAAAEADGNYREMLVLLEAAAAAGHVAAQERLGVALLHGEGLYGDAVPRDRCKAVYWLRLAAGRGGEVGKMYNSIITRLDRDKTWSCNAAPR